MLKLILWIVFFVILFFVAIIFSMIQTKIKRISNRKKSEQREEYLTKRYLQDHPWRRLDYYHEEDQHRERLTSQKISSLLNRKAKEIIEPYLSSLGFYPCKKNRPHYRMIKDGIVYEITIDSILKSQRGLRALYAYLYPLCLVYAKEEEEGEVNSYFYIKRKQGELELPFHFDCAVEENLCNSIIDIRDLIQELVIPFFDQFNTLNDLEKLYITPYQKSDITDIKQYTILYRNAAFYIGEGKYQEAKQLLSLLYQNKEAYRKKNQKLLAYYEHSGQDTKSRWSSDDRATAEYYKQRMQLYEQHMKTIEFLLDMLDDPSNIQEWHEHQLKEAQRYLTKPNLYWIYIL